LRERAIKNLDNGKWLRFTLESLELTAPFNLRKYHGKLLIKPAPTSIAAVKEKARITFKAGMSMPQGLLIHRLNPVLRGWAYFYRHVVSKQVFGDIDNAIWRMTWNWARRRHPRKRSKWIKDRYYASNGGRNGIFTDGETELFRMSSLPIRRHLLIRGEANPYDPDWAEYFRRRSIRQGPLPTEPPEWDLV
jgi:RNA-directed DNA polymerase